MSTVAEMLLGDGGHEEISRRVRIAAAWLGGVNDADRDVIHDFAKALYNAGSAYRHGGSLHTLHRGEPDAPTGRNTLDVSRGYRLLRRLMLHGLAVVADDESPAALCERAQRTDAARDQLRTIIFRLYAELGVKPTPFAASPTARKRGQLRGKRAAADGPSEKR